MCVFPPGKHAIHSQRHESEPMSTDTAAIVADPTPSNAPGVSTANLFPSNMVLRFAYGLAVEVVLNFAAYTCNEEGVLTESYELNPAQQALIVEVVQDFCLEHREDLGLMGPFWRDGLSVRVANNPAMNMPRMGELLKETFAKHGITLIDQRSHPRVPVRR